MGEWLCLGVGEGRGYGKELMEWLCFRTGTDGGARRIIISAKQVMVRVRIRIRNP